jgi:hypothetical protein
MEGSTRSIPGMTATWFATRKGETNRDAVAPDKQAWVRAIKTERKEAELKQWGDG